MKISGENISFFYCEIWRFPVQFQLFPSSDSGKGRENAWWIPMKSPNVGKIMGRPFCSGRWDQMCTLMSGCICILCCFLDLKFISLSFSRPVSIKNLGWLCSLFSTSSPNFSHFAQHELRRVFRMFWFTAWGTWGDILAGSLQCRNPGSLPLWDELRRTRPGGTDSPRVWFACLPKRHGHHGREGWM